MQVHPLMNPFYKDPLYIEPQEAWCWLALLGHYVVMRSTVLLVLIGEDPCDDEQIGKAISAVNVSFKLTYCKPWDFFTLQKITSESTPVHNSPGQV